MIQCAISPNFNVFAFDHTTSKNCPLHGPFCVLFLTNARFGVPLRSSEPITARIKQDGQIVMGAFVQVSQLSKYSSPEIKQMDSKYAYIHAVGCTNNINRDV